MPVENYPPKDIPQVK